MKTTLVELPPEDPGLEDESLDFIRADTVEELAQQTHIGNETVLNRVLLPGKNFGPYLILGFVAAGGMGEIYAARRIASDGRRSRPVALKVIAAEYANDWRIIERFKREARISKAIQSPYVARVYEFGESEESHAFLSMELLKGEELFDRLHREKMLKSKDLADLSLQILQGLQAIHQSGFVHRDIKPENVFLSQDKEGNEHVKILDFGIAKRQDQRSDPLLSIAGQIYGTPQYLAPEQAVSPDVDHRADIYSLGVVMYEAMAGNLPFDGDTNYALIMAHQSEEASPLPSTVDPELAEIIFKALAKKPEDRYQSAREMAMVLSRWVEGASWAQDFELEVPRRRTYLTPFRNTSSTPFILTDDDFDDLSEESLPGMQALKPRVSGGFERSDPTGESAAPMESQSGELDEESTRRAHLITWIAIGLIGVAVVWALVSSLLSS